MRPQPVCQPLQRGYRLAGTVLGIDVGAPCPSLAGIRSVEAIVSDARPLDGKRILVTGGTGSLGKVLVRRLLSNEMGTPGKIIVLSRDEAKQQEMRMRHKRMRQATEEIIYRSPGDVLEFRIGDVR